MCVEAWTALRQAHLVGLCLPPLGASFGGMTLDLCTLDAWGTVAREGRVSRLSEESEKWARRSGTPAQQCERAWAAGSATLLGVASRAQRRCECDVQGRSSAKCFPWKEV